MKIYTKKGDKGSTSLYRGGVTSKASLRIAAIGEVDELNCHIGMIITLIKDVQTSDLLQHVQNELFDIGADLATIRQAEKVSTSPNTFKPSSEIRLEEEIDRLDGKLDPLKNFILPGGVASAAAVHLARSVCRRAERAVVAAGEESDVNPTVLIYLNRLSDFLFMLARYQNTLEGSGEILWKSRDSA